MQLYELACSYMSLHAGLRALMHFYECACSSMSLHFCNSLRSSQEVHSAYLLMNVEWRSIPWHPSSPFSCPPSVFMDWAGEKELQLIISVLQSLILSQKIIQGWICYQHASVVGIIGQYYAHNYTYLQYHLHLVYSLS